MQYVLIFELQHDLHELTDLNVVDIFVGWIKKQCQVLIIFSQLLNFDVFWGFLLAHWEKKASLKLRIGFFSALSLFLFLLKGFLLKMVLNSFFLRWIDSKIFWGYFFVINVLSFVGDEGDSVLSPELFDVFWFIVLVGTSRLLFGGILGTASLSF